MAEKQFIKAQELLEDSFRLGLKVLEVIQERALVLQWEPAGSTWTFALEPDGERGCVDAALKRSLQPDAKPVCAGDVVYGGLAHGPDEF